MGASATAALLSAGATTTAATETTRQTSVPNGVAEVIRAEDGDDFELPYLLYRPESRDDSERPLYVKTHNSPDSATTDELIGGPTVMRRPDLAGAVANRFPAIVPGFPRTPNDGPDYIQSLTLPSYKSDLVGRAYKLDDISNDSFSKETLTRVDEQLLAMIDDAKARLADESYQVADQIHMSGFSAACTFANRFAFLYPDEVRAIAAGGSILLPIPKASHDGTTLPFPLGTADYEELTGRSFDREAWATIDRYIFLGRDDQPLPETDNRGYYEPPRYRETVREVFGMNRVTERYPFVKSQYNEFSDNAVFQIFDDIGHSIDGRMEEAMVGYHRRQKHQAYGPQFEQRVEAPPQTVTVGETFRVRVSARNLGADPATVTLALAVNGETVESTDVEVQSEAVESADFEYAFSSAGEDTVSVSGASTETFEVVAEPQQTEEPTESSAATEQATETATDTQTPQPETVSDDQPGFGVVQALLASGGVGYLLKQRLSDDDD